MDGIILTEKEMLKLYWYLPECWLAILIFSLPKFINKKFYKIFKMKKKIERVIMRSALIIGINGQDGTYLSKFLISKNYNIYGIIKPKSKNKLNIIFSDLLHKNNVKIFEIDTCNYCKIKILLNDIKPDEIYYLSSTHEYPLGQENYDKVFSVNVQGFVNVLEVLRQDLPQTKIFYSSSSNIFSGSTQSPQDESTTKSPSTLYGVAKATAMNLLAIYRKKIIFLQHVEFYIIMNLFKKKEFLQKKLLIVLLILKIINKNFYILVI